MRNLVEPPPSTHCERCDGELLFKRIEPDNPDFDYRHPGIRLRKMRSWGASRLAETSGCGN
jgi:hypothetical protein